MAEEQERACICIDLKSYYASVECVKRGLDPLKAYLLVADESRTDGTICLAVSPALKALGVPGRPRLFEAKRVIRRYEEEHKTRIPYIIAIPRMAEYEKISAKIYGIYLRYIAPEDIHVYSIDECFMECGAYLHLYREEAERNRMHPARLMAITMVRAVLAETGITATAGIGTNLYLAKVAMDIVAKKKPADRDGVRIAELNEASYKYLLWDHRPLTDFWQIGPGKARRLAAAHIFTMGQIAERSLLDEEFFYRTFGVDGEILIDHAWGIEPVTMKEIKAYQPEHHGLSSGQVLPRPYSYEETRVVLAEMVDGLCIDMGEKKKEARIFGWSLSFDPVSLERCPDYDGPVTLDYYNRLHPKHVGGIVRLSRPTALTGEVWPKLLADFDKRCDHRLFIRRINVSAEELQEENGFYQMELFVDEEKREKEKHLFQAIRAIRRKYGEAAVVRGLNLREGATAIERSQQIGGHRA